MVCSTTKGTKTSQKLRLEQGLYCNAAKGARNVATIRPFFSAQRDALARN
jgi:hypothetical protein